MTGSWVQVSAVPCCTAAFSVIVQERLPHVTVKAHRYVGACPAIEGIIGRVRQASCRRSPSA
jgi:hypothetical protein